MTPTPAGLRYYKRCVEAVGALEHAAEEARSMAGEVTATRVVPRSSGSWLEATLDDGTGSVVAIFMGRPSIPAVHPGALLELEGTIAEDHGRRQTLNPLYRRLAVPHA